MNNWGGRLGVFDLETTGVDVRTARIVSACVAVLDADGTVIERRDWLADPGVEIPEQASAVHGITTERARREGRPAVEVVAEITSALRELFAGGTPVTVYNAPYDLTLLAHECVRYSLEVLAHPGPVIDPLVLDKAVDRYRRGKRTLEITAQHYRVALDDAHDAGADAIAAGRVAQALAKAFPAELDLDPRELHTRQASWFAEQAASFEEYMRRVKDPSFVAARGWPVR
ncbi:3'-5' exonuclease [uncultured Schumannella sp.]|jgi:DNA polymerase III subunit epsilon|uniref:3'-5' exonuclease n=1 Tax=uncultured Schumannella sp. TaxID=1195956 RepID=UPI0025D49775|nr:3'-5' exonuclease [uncultured Schumannella sp.]